MALLSIASIAGRSAVLAAALGALVVLCLSTTASAADLSVVSGSVIDVGGTRIRLWGIRSPETDAMCRRGDAGDACSATSRRVLERLIGNEELRCLVKTGLPGQPIVAQCSVRGDDLGHLMVLSGWATDDRAESGGHYAMQEEVAREERVGMWKYR